jgi:hypothetical protein
MMPNEFGHCLTSRADNDRMPRYPWKTYEASAFFTAAEADPRFRMPGIRRTIRLARIAASDG